jgi:transposase InsO family protein/transposase-like protein
MPWKESTAVEERSRFAMTYLSGAFQMSELCAQYGITRPTGYKWVKRFESGGRAAMVDRSRAPHHCPHRMDESLQAWFIKARKRFGWGARKLLVIFCREYPQAAAPSRTAISDLIERAGLSKSRGRRRRKPQQKGSQASASRPNALWTIDFKGQFKTLDHLWCFPLTLRDLCSRYVFRVSGQLDCNTDPAKRRIEATFREYGLPDGIHSDNGPPFASGGIAGLSRMSVHWVKLGIRLFRSRPGCPQDNGAHERMHRTLKDCTARPPAKSLRAQQRRFDRFVREYNELRPHESLNDRTPASIYRPSPRSYPSRLPKPDYPSHFDIRRVSHNGYVSWRAQSFYIGLALAHEHVAFEPIDEALWSIHFYHQLLGRFDARTAQIIPL